MRLTAGRLPSLAQQLDEARHATPRLRNDPAAVGRAQGVATIKAKGAASRKAVIGVFEKLGTADTATLSLQTGLCGETCRNHCAALVAAGLLRINPTRPASWSVKR